MTPYLTYRRRRRPKFRSAAAYLAAPHRLGPCYFRLVGLRIASKVPGARHRPGGGCLYWICRAVRGLVCEALAFCGPSRPPQPDRCDCGGGYLRPSTGLLQLAVHYKSLGLSRRGGISGSFSWKAFCVRRHPKESRICRSVLHNQLIASRP